MSDSTKFVVLTAAALAALAGGCEERGTTTSPTVSGPGMNDVTDTAAAPPTGGEGDQIIVGDSVDRSGAHLEDPWTDDEEAPAPPLEDEPVGSPLPHEAAENRDRGEADGGVARQPEGPRTDSPDVAGGQNGMDAQREAENVAAREAALRQAEGGTPELSPEMAELLGDLDGLAAAPITELDAVEARQQPWLPDAVAVWEMRTQGGSSPEEVGAVENRTYETLGGEQPVRVYWPVGAGERPRDLPITVYYHGGGFVLGSIDEFDASARAICNAADCIVVAPQYRQAPEAPFPAAVEDAVAAYEWAVTSAAELGGDPTRVAVAGESAGGNLAAVVSLTCREQGMQMPVHQVLIYPVGDWTFDSPSYEEHASGTPLTGEMMAWFKEQYLGTEGADIDWRAAPLRAESFERLPPTTIITAQVDPLRSEGEVLAVELQQAGVPVNHVNFDGVVHGFFVASAVVPEARQAVEVVGTDLRNAFGVTVGEVETEGP
jgi:acetyl esterase/lipase